MYSKYVVALSLGLLLALTAPAQSWQPSGPNMYFTGSIAIGATSFPGKLSVMTPIVAGGVSTAAIFGYSNDLTNRSVSIQQLGNASTATQYFFLNGSLGSASALGSPKLSSLFAPSFGFECGDNNLSILSCALGTNQTPVRAMTILPGGQVLLGKTTQTNGNYLLDVNGSGRCNKMVVNSTGADYVFAPEYRLPSLGSVAEYIGMNRHLPGIESAMQMQEQGLDVGGNQTALLAKIEELTLYIIDQDRRMKRVEEIVKQQQLLIDRMQK